MNATLLQLSVAMSWLATFVYALFLYLLALFVLRWSGIRDYLLPSDALMIARYNDHRPLASQRASNTLTRLFPQRRKGCHIDHDSFDV